MFGRLGLFIICVGWVAAMGLFPYAHAQSGKAKIADAATVAGSQGSADRELAAARKIGWTQYSTLIYNRVNGAYLDGLTSVNPAEIWTNYACVATGDTLKRLGHSEMNNIDLVMRTHLATSSVFIIQDGTMRRDPNSFTSEEMFAVVTMMQERFTDAAQQDVSIIPELKKSYASCASSLRAESRKIEE